MLRSLLLVVAALSCTDALVATSAVSMSKVSASRVSGVDMGAKKKPAAAPTPKGKSPKGKGGILPWVTNEPGTYAEVMNLSSFNFLGDDGDKLVGWGFMPKSVKKLYPKRSSGKK
ncbi:hypothetical protein AB1Y20_006111 [Prymnesium parvum]|uniref:Phospholipase B-like n=1 Tax=Prymnesium parvum TaxID=97485 RepID=A0AB34J2B5_PRYPA|mmetsp:Transcript_6243/g.15793  ORF Transcript_6243/g.15793 Transcript_6243/m.15793 type:complete len:115 (+) Transcript_6243:64-408(+)